MASDPVDFRKGHDGLAALVQSQLRQKPFDGSVYVFRAKRADRLKLIYWDGSGLVMAYKRLEDNSFTWPAIKNGVMRLRGPFEQTVISSIAIDLQGAAEALQDIVRILAGSPRRIGEGHAGRILTAPWPVIPGQGPEVACFGAFASRSQNRFEKDLRGLIADQRHAARQECSKPIIDTLELWLAQSRARVSAKSPTGEALKYIAKYWDGLCLFLDDGRIELDNNTVERTIRPIALNRKNALFAGHDAGAQNWAVIASLIETCKLNGIEPHGYLSTVLKAIVSGHKQTQINELLPWNYVTPV